jgi:hypothetical protein
MHDAQLVSVAVDDSDFLFPDFFIDGEFFITDIRSPPLFRLVNKFVPSTRFYKIKGAGKIYPLQNMHVNILLIMTHPDVCAGR